MVSLDVFMRGFVAKVLARDGLHLLAAAGCLSASFTCSKCSSTAVKNGVKDLTLSQTHGQQYSSCPAFFRAYLAPALLSRAAAMV